MHKKDRHLMYPLQCDCMHSSDEEEEGAYEFSPPQDVNNIPWIIIQEDGVIMSTTQTVFISLQIL